MMRSAMGSGVRPAILLLATIQVLMILGPLTVTAQDPPADESQAWEALWDNRFREALGGFESVLEDDEDRPSALRGLILTSCALGRDGLVMDAFERYTDDAPHGPYDFLLLDYISNSLQLEGKKHVERLMKFARKLAEEDDLELIDRRRSQAALMAYYHLLGQPDKVSQTAEKLNRISDFAILGPFDNVAGSGHRKTHLTEFDYIPPRTFAGKFGQPINWFRPRLVSLSGDYVPAYYFHRRFDVTAYLATRVHVPDSGTYLLSIGYAGDVDIHINNEFMASCPPSGSGSEMRHWEIDLPVGWVSLAFKVSGDDRLGWLSCSLSMPDGRAIKGLGIDPGAGVAAPISDPDPRERRGRWFPQVKEMAGKVSPTKEAVFWNLYRAAFEESPENLDRINQAAVESHPECGLILLQALGSTGGEGPSYEGSLERILEVAPDLATARILQADLDIGKRRYDLAVEGMDHVLEAGNDIYGARMKKIEALEKNDLWEEVNKEAGWAAYNFPDEPEAQYAIMRYNENLGSLREVKEAREKGDERQLPGARYVKGFLRDWEQEDFGDARDDIEALVELQPEIPFWWYANIMAMITDGETQRALDTILMCLESFPQDLGLQNFYSHFVESGAILVDMGNVSLLTPEGAQRVLELKRGHSANYRSELEKVLKREAAFVLKDALVCEPGNFQLRDRVNALLGMPSFRRSMPDPDIGAIESQRVDPDGRPGDDAVVLLSQKRRLVFDNTASLVDHVVAVQILTNRGLERWENVDLPVSPVDDPVIVTMVAIDEDGRQRDGEQVGGTVIFPGLSEGDLIVIHYQTSDYVSGNLAGKLWDQHLFSFPEDPCLTSSYQIIVPDGFAVDAKTWNDETYKVEGYPKKTAVTGKLTSYLFKYRDVPASSREPLSPSARTYLPWIDMSNIPGWEVIAAWYSDIAGGQADPDHRVRGKAESLTEGLDTEEESVEAIYNFVSNEIRYEYIPLYQSAFVPRQANVVLEDGFGDCKDKACLMIALLDAAGYEGYRYALVTPGAPAATPYMPSPRFNHVIVAKRGEGDSVAWYDPTMRGGDHRQVPRSLAGTVALIVDGRSDRLVMIKGDPLNIHPSSATTQVQIENSGDGLVDRRQTLRQVDQMAWARNFEGEGGLEEWRVLQGQYLATRYPGVEVQDVSLDGLEPGRDQVDMTTRFLVPYFGVDEEGIMSVRLPWSSQLSDRYGMVVAEADRKIPVDLWRLNMCEMDTVVITMPPGKTLARVPKGVDLQWKTCHYTTAFEKTAGGLLATRRLEINGKMVKGDAYPGFKEFLDQVRRDLGRTHHLRLN